MKIALASVLVLFAAGIGGCGDGDRASRAGPAARATPPAAALGEAERGSGRLRGTQFARSPVVWIGRCAEADCPRQPRGYSVYFRLNRSLPERRPGTGDIKFKIAAMVDVNGVRGFDPMTRLGARRFCYEHAVLVDERRTFPLDIGGDDRPGVELPRPGGLVRVTVSTYRGDFEEPNFRIDGKLSAMVRVRPPEPPARATDYRKPDAQRAAGC